MASSSPTSLMIAVFAGRWVACLRLRVVGGRVVVGKLVIGRVVVVVVVVAVLAVVAGVVFLVVVVVVVVGYSPTQRPREVVQFYFSTYIHST